MTSLNLYTTKDVKADITLDWETFVSYRTIGITGTNQIPRINITLVISPNKMKAREVWMKP